MFGDNAGSGAFGTDGDGNVSKADEHIEIQSATGMPLSLDGIEIWSAREGCRMVEKIPPGDLVLTLAAGLVPVPGIFCTWLGGAVLAALPDLGPVTFEAGSVGNARPALGPGAPGRSGWGCTILLPPNFLLPDLALAVHICRLSGRTSGVFAPLRSR